MVLACILAAQDAPFACNMKVFTPTERKQHEAFTRHILAAVSEHREVSQGYAFELDAARVSLIDLARWASNEKRCCPFFDFQMNLTGGLQPRLSLTLTGREGVKQFIREEFRPVFADGP
jgi:hypothetical protein